MFGIVRPGLARLFQFRPL